MVDLDSKYAFSIIEIIPACLFDVNVLCVALARLSMCCVCHRAYYRTLCAVFGIERNM